MRPLSDQELAQITREIAAILRDWFAEDPPARSEEALALIVIALQQRGLLFGDGRLEPARAWPQGENVVPFPTGAGPQARLRL
jgi:hypothetical protein